MEIKQVVLNAQRIIELAEQEGWSEGELAKAIKLLHSELQYQFDVFTLSQFETTEK